MGTRAEDRPDEPARRQAILELTRQALGSLSEGRLTVSDRTQSMAPLLRGGEVLHWRRPAAAPRTGDLLVFVQAVGPIVHRVVGRRAGGLLTKGDNRPACDVDLVPPGEVLGVVVAVERGGAVRAHEGRRPRLYALAATALSRGGEFLHRFAYYGDAVLRRVPGWGDRRLCRAPAFWVQAAGQRLLHALLARACHPQVRTSSAGR